MKRNFTELVPVFRKAALVGFLSVVICATGVIAAGSFTEPGGGPPGSNASAPVNTSSVTQVKSGNFTATTIGASNGYCIGAACITSWPVAPTADINSCQICFHVVNDDNRGPGQCGGSSGGIPQGGGTTCVPINQWTTTYRDDTDNRKGGCQMQWMIDCVPPYGDAGSVVQTAPTSGDAGIANDWSNVYSGNYTGVQQ